MEEDHRLVTVISFLDHQEATEIRNILLALKINCLLGTHGGRKVYYLLRVEQKDLAIAKPVINRFKKRMLVESMECPTCKQYAHVEVEKKGFWQTIFYFGTRLVECRKCKTRFSV